jgi:hypothetical protein
MGSIVNAIGRVISGIADAIKKIAPALLLAAAIYVGYGFMTGFQAGGWPNVLNWGKSLVSGLTQGDSISGATAAADVGAEVAEGVVGAESTTDVMSAVAGGGDIATAGPVAETVAETAETITGSDIGGWEGSRFFKVLDQIGDSSGELASRTGSAFGNWLMSSAQGDTNAAALDAAQASTTTDTATAAQYGESPEAYASMFGPEGDIPGVSDPTLPQKIMAMGGKAWNIYKNMWKTNPGMAMWTTNNILRTVLAMMDNSAEEEAYAAGHVAGFAPDTWANIKERVGGKLPGGGPSGYTASRRPSSGLKVGRLPEATASRTSAIDRKPAGIIGPQAQRTV